MKLLVGLGNPGQKYKNTWHNLGFLAVEEFVKTHSDDLTGFKTDKKNQTEVTYGKIDGQKVVVTKPQTFMNNSGQAVRALANFYKIKLNDVIVIHDDIDIALGKIKISYDASAAGHKGLQSIIAELGSQKFYRLRLGIKSKNQGKVPTEDYVLQKIKPGDKITINKVIKDSVQAIELILADNLPTAQNQFN